MVSCARATGISMRIAVGINFITGIILIIFGCYVQNPPKAFAPVAFVILGCLNICASLVGFMGSFHKKRLLLGFMVCGGFSVLLQIALVLSLLFAFDNVVNRITKGDPQEKKDMIGKNLNIARWVALGFIFVEVLTLTMAVLLRFVIKEEQPYDAFDPENAQKRSTALDGLTKDIERATKGKSMSEKAYDKIRSKMSAKYGTLSHGESDWKAKTKFSWK